MSYWFKNKNGVEYEIKDELLYVKKPEPSNKWQPLKEDGIWKINADATHVFVINCGDRIATVTGKLKDLI